jgi:hypothetical protein
VLRLPFNRPLTGGRRVSWLTCPLAEIAAIRKRRGGTINDVALSVLTGGIGRWLAASGFDTRGRYLRLLVPVNVRREHQRGLLGNRVSMVPIEVPFDGTALDRLAHTVARSDAMKQAGIADLVAWTGEAAAVLPASLCSAALSLAATPAVLALSAPLRTAPFLTANLVCTNVPGPPVPLYGLGCRLVAHYPLVPLGFETGLNCAVFTYNQVLHFGLVADAGAIDDLEPLTGLVRAAYEDLRDAAGVPRSTTARADPSSG